MNDFDDPELGRLLGQLAGRPPERDAAYGRLQGGIRRARRRRAAVWGSTAMAAGLLGTAAFAAPWRDDGPRISAAEPASDPTSTAATFATTTIVGPTVTIASAPATTAPVDSTATTADQSSVTAGSGPASTAAAAPPTAPGGSSAAPPSASPTSAPPSTSAPTTAGPAPTSTEAPGPSSTSTTCSSPQGVGFAVTLTNGVLTRGAVTANGYQATTTESRTDRIEIEFVRGSERVKVRADADGGSIRCTAQTETENHESSDSSVTGGDDHGNEPSDSDDG